LVGVGWQWTPTTLASSGDGKVYIAPVVPVGNQVSFTRQTSSPPAHTSNLGKVGSVPYTRGGSFEAIHFRVERVGRYSSLRPSITVKRTSILSQQSGLHVNIIPSELLSSLLSSLQGKTLPNGLFRICGRHC
jgi:hypothetical protein